MRTTLEIDEEVLAAARSLARAEGKSIGKVISELARRGLAPRPSGASRGFPIFEVSADAPPLTTEMVTRAAEDAD